LQGYDGGSEVIFRRICDNNLQRLKPPLQKTFGRLTPTKNGAGKGGQVLFRRINDNNLQRLKPPLQITFGWLTPAKMVWVRVNKFCSGGSAVIIFSG
jgi:hypothetical protein